MNASKSITICTGLLSLCLFSAATAADFSGNLKGVSITDSQAANKPPVAAFTYSHDGQAIILDAGTSSDPDGSIVKYKWVVGDIQVAEGVTASYNLVGEEPVQVTLTVIDNNSGAALIQQTVVPTKDIRDDFSTDTSANYAVLIGKGLSVYDGSLHTGAWSTTIAYHKTSLGSNDHSVEADITYIAGFGGGLMVRFDPVQNTGYVVVFESGRIYLNKYVNGTSTYLSMHDGKYVDGRYKVNVTVIGQMITITVNGSTVLTKTDTSFVNGTYVGVRIRAGAEATSTIADNFIATKQ